MELPSELLESIVPWMPPRAFLSVVCPAARCFSFEWYLSLCPNVVIVPDDAPTINRGINALTQGAKSAARKPRIDGHMVKGGIVLIRPGIYPESVRVTRNCYIFGLGRLGDVTVEAPGWESALVFSGLGRLERDPSLGSGEDSTVCNVTFRCKNEQMRGRCVYIVLGKPHVEHCDIQGTVQICGARTTPRLLDCRIHGSRGSGVHITDHSRGAVLQSSIVQHGRHGVLADRGSRPNLCGNRISANRLFGVRLLVGDWTKEPLKDDQAHAEAPADLLQSNVFSGNGAGEVSASSHFADEVEDVLDADSDGDDGFIPEHDGDALAAQW